MITHGNCSSVHDIWAKADTIKVCSNTVCGDSDTFDIIQSKYIFQPYPLPPLIPLSLLRESFLSNAIFEGTEFVILDENHQVILNTNPAPVVRTVGADVMKQIIPSLLAAGV